MPIDCSGLRRRSARNVARAIFTASPGRNGSTHYVRLSCRLIPVMTMNQIVPNT